MYNLYIYIYITIIIHICIHIYIHIERERDVMCVEYTYTEHPNVTRAFDSKTIRISGNPSLPLCDHMV